MLSGDVRGFSHSSGHSLGSPIAISMVLEGVYFHYDTREDKTHRSIILNVKFLIPYLDYLISTSSLDDLAKSEFQCHIVNHAYILMDLFLQT